MEQVSGNSTLKRHCNYIVDLCSLAKIVTIKENLYQSIISYPYPRLVTIFIKITSVENLKKAIAIAFKKINYTSSTISYTNPPLVTLLSTISYTRIAKSTVISIKTGFFLKPLKFFIKLVLKSKGRHYEK